MEETFTVTGMTCGHCVMSVTEAISTVTGVAAVDVDLTSGTTVVRGDGFDAAAVRTAVAEAGYGTN